MELRIKFKNQDIREYLCDKIEFAKCVEIVGDVKKDKSFVKLFLNKNSELQLSNFVGNWTDLKIDKISFDIDEIECFEIKN